MFIKLTDIHDGTFTCINPRQITAFFGLGNGSTKIYDIVAENSYEVKETPEQILALIEAERRKEHRKCPRCGAEAQGAEREGKNDRAKTFVQ